MQALAVAAIAFVGLFGGVCAGMWGARRLKEEHLSKSTEDAVKLGVGMVAAMSSLILGLMTASVKGNFDTTGRDVQQFTTDLITLDTSLRAYGPGADDARRLLTAYTRHALAETWPERPEGRVRVDGVTSKTRLEAVGYAIRMLASATPVEAELRAEALDRYKAAATLRWTVVAESVTAVPPVFTAVLIVWLCLIFVSFGLFSPVNVVSLVVFLLCAVSLAGALFLILEMSSPFDGIIRVPDTAMKGALAQMLR
ncbi:bestrophin-like domain [Xanthobacter sediminis]|uniref:bestrophin-like domain n=1 Tax=Xanthobacter sediminis TaxID=3119926 RepID=UPI00372AAD81